MRSHFILLPFFMLFNINTYLVTSQCLVHQQSLLLQLKESLTFNPAKSQKLSHWNQSVDCCQWNGVSCNKGHVVGLDLSNEYISRGLNNDSSLFNLQHLHTLNLAYNDFGSLIPAEIEKLKNLRHLNISNAGFHGKIPNEVSHLTNFVTLDLTTSLASSQSALKLDEKMNIRMLMQNLTQITELYLDGVTISASGNEWCQVLSSLSKLQVLSMSSCNLSGPVDSSLAKLRSLRVLRLNLNNISSSVPESFANFFNLTILNLNNCNLRGVFPKGIFQIQKLKELDVSNNQDLQGFLPNFPKDGYLESLNLSYTNFSGKLVSSISNLKQLSVLDLSHCQFNGTLNISFSAFSHLVHLDLSSNKLSGPIPSFNNSKNLRYLSLLENELNGTIPPTHLKGLSSLSIINLGFNFFSGKIPVSLFTLPSLQEVTLFHNRFEGVLDEFPNSSHSPINMIDLSMNKLEGHIPVSFFHLKRLRFLQLSSNKFNGTIQLGMIFQRLPHLQNLGLSGNNLSVDAIVNDTHGVSSFPILLNLLLSSCNLTEIPSFIRNQSQLLALDLSSNQIQGIIPNWILKSDSMVSLNLSNNLFTELEGFIENPSSNLMMIDLHSNQICGSVPFFSNYTVYLDCSNNRFSFISHETIRKYRGHMRSMLLANNRLHGRIPESLCSYSDLRLLDLSHNNFDGFIPECLTKGTNILKVLNLGGNKLKGYISDTISSSCNFRSLDLSKNTLSGTIPKSLVNCQRLEVLNLGSNLLQDEFPCFLRNISTLQVLILRFNKLHGPIGCTHNNTGNWEMLHIVDLSFNNFIGTLPRTLVQSLTAMMDGGNGKRENTRYLFFDLYDFYHSVNYNDMLSTINYGKKLAKLFAAEPSSAIENLYSYNAGVNQFPYGGGFLDSVVLVNKGLQMRFIKILSVFASLDFSSNHFEGPIPEELMRLNALINLNLSNNAFSSHIPSSIGNLTQLESLDMSNNFLIGEIPPQISELNFLQVLNLSFNQLVGRIPAGTQIQSFEADSFEGNEGLCGPPLTKDCDVQQSTPATFEDQHVSIGWKFLSAELGFIFGFGLVILPLLFWKRWRVIYNKHVDDLLWNIFPQLFFVYQQRGEHKYRTLRWRW